MSSYGEKFDAYYKAVEEALPAFLPQGDTLQKTVQEAMAYSLLGGGKRIRGVLCLAFCELCGGTAEAAMPFACAIEMVHAYSLIHDDLPCMDNDDLRRGKPSCHVQYGEAMALLAGDGLLTLGFETILNQYYTGKYPPERIARAGAELAAAIGSQGMIGGQVIDIQHEGKPISAGDLNILHSLKTGALIRASAKLGCIVAGASDDIIARADKYAKNIGIAFQITDDVLNVTSTEEKLGKPVDSDQEMGKTTYATLYGVEKSRQIVKDLVLEADLAIKGSVLDDPFLYQLADQLAQRDC
jgi:geranylgeranyl diphosphate synthase type II